MLNRFVSSSITEYLTDEEKTDLRIAYRGNRRDFTDSDAVKSLNSKLQTDYSFNNKVLSLNLRENEIDSWKNEMSLSLDEIRLKTQVLVHKIWLNQKCFYNRIQM